MPHDTQALAYYQAAADPLGVTVTEEPVEGYLGLPSSLVFHLADGPLFTLGRWVDPPVVFLHRRTLEAAEAQTLAQALTLLPVPGPDPVPADRVLGIWAEAALTA